MIILKGGYSDVAAKEYDSGASADFELPLKKNFKAYGIDPLNSIEQTLATAAEDGALVYLHNSQL